MKSIMKRTTRRCSQICLYQIRNLSTSSNSSTSSTSSTQPQSSTSFDCFGLPQTLTLPDNVDLQTTTDDYLDGYHGDKHNDKHNNYHGDKHNNYLDLNNELILKNMTLKRWGLKEEDIDPNNPKGGQREPITSKLPDYSPALALLDR